MRGFSSTFNLTLTKPTIHTPLMSLIVDIIISEGKRISGTKYQPCTKAEARLWAHKKYLQRMETLQEDIKWLEDENTKDYISSNSDSKLKEKCRTYQTFKKMSEEVIKTQPVVFEKARAVQKTRKIRARRNGGKRLTQY